MKTINTPRGLSRGLAVMLSVTVIAVMIWQGRALSQVRQERARLAAAKDAGRAAPSPEELRSLRDAAQEAESLRAANRDLHKLRNEVAQLRRRRGELDRAKAEHQRLQAAKAAYVERQALSREPDFVARESLTDAGLASPEATVQTFFWAMRESRFDRFLHCLAPALEQSMAPELQNPDQQAEAAKIMKAISGYRITEMTAISPDEIVLRVQSELFGNEARKLPLKRYGQEWKFERMLGPE